MPMRMNYRSDDGWAWGRLPGFVTLSLLVALFCGWILARIFVSGWYYALIVPFLVTAAFSGVIHHFVGWAEFRNRWLASVFGAVIGVIFYLSYFQFCLPVPLWHRIELLPRVILLRMKTDVKEDDRAARQKRINKPDEFSNWFGFGIELVFASFCVAMVAGKRAGRAFHSERDCWMSRETTSIPRYSGQAFVNALESGELLSFVANTSPGQDTQTASEIAVEYLNGHGSPLKYAVYVTVEDFPPNPRWWRPKQLRTTLLQQSELTSSEALILRAWVPQFAEALSVEHKELRDVPANVPQPATSAAPTTDVMQVTPVPEPYRQKVRTNGYAWKVNLIGAAPALYFFGGLGLLALGLYLDMAHNNRMACGISIVFAAVGVSAGCYLGAYCLAVPENRWIERRLRSELALRPNPIVHATDEDAVYVSLIPRAHFTTAKLTMSTDLLLLKLDQKKQQLLLEGDCDRYWIPAGSISVCETQLFFHPLDAQHQNELWMIRLMVQTEQGPQELLLSESRTKYWPPTTNRRRRLIAEEMCQRIGGLCFLPETPNAE